jgi:hypothetical protein
MLMPDANQELISMVEVLIPVDQIAACGTSSNTPSANE